MKLPDSPASLLQELIQIPSVNPDGAPGQNATGEKICAEWVGDFLEACGAEVTYEKVLPDRPNVQGRFPGGENKPGLLFAPHTDTVSVKGMTIDPFAAEIKEGKIYGRGASDTKGTMAAMLWALYQLREEIPRYSHAVSFVGFMGEEAGQPGSKHFAEHHANEFEFAVVGEPTSLDTVYASKGCVWLELTARGVSCHGSTPERGDNAIRKLIPLLPPLLQTLEEQLSGFADETLGLPTVSLGKISGGTSPNIVPAQCSAILDFRETPALHKAGGGRKLLDDFLHQAGIEKEIEVSVVGDSVPLFTDPGTDGIQRLQSIGSSLTTAPWFCDAGRLGEKGLPAVACGPGNIAQAHTKDEFLSIQDLNAGVDFYTDFLRTYL
ncbi:MAG: M20 family metallopeptidase [Verrucomicrobiales bacterium]|nr:M20 family metallopeptidase [Verrucomicrobiales bacterium]